jgi:hypothetical protein
VNRISEYKINAMPRGKSQDASIVVNTILERIGLSDVVNCFRSFSVRMTNKNRQIDVFALIDS